MGPAPRRPRPRGPRPACRSGRRLRPQRHLHRGHPSDGEHRYFHAPTDTTIRNTVGLLGSRIDTRAAVGTIVAAGSVRRINGLIRQYRVIHHAHPTLALHRAHHDHPTPRHHRPPPAAHRQRPTRAPHWTEKPDESAPPTSAPAISPCSKPPPDRRTHRHPRWQAVDPRRYPLKVCLVRGSTSETSRCRSNNSAPLLHLLDQLVAHPLGPRRPAQPAPPP